MDSFPPPVSWSPPAAPTPPPIATPAAKRSRSAFVIGVVLLVITAWLAALLGAVVGYQLADNDSTPDRRASTLGISVEEPRETALPTLDVAGVAAVIAPSVVAIQAISENGSSVGTGVVITSDGEIITNAHVVDGADTINVRLAGDTEPMQATLVAADTSRDLALLRVDAGELPAATFAAADDVRVGDEVVAVGYALDLDGDPSVTRGIVSALDRTLTTGDQVVLTGLVQTDAAISSGNSGGPLVNSLGQVLGINTLVADSQQPGRAANNLGFAISAEQVLDGIERLRAESTGTAAAAGFLGVGLAARADGGSGAQVTDVVADSPADLAGVQVGDVVIAVDDEPIDGQAALVAVIRDRGPGVEVTIELVRAGEPLTVTATLAERPAE
jgi:S1-C subfamily serine protease